MEEIHYHVTLVRHAESEGNVRHLFQGQEDYPLSEQGRLQAQSLAGRLKREEYSCDQIIASPLSRAWETAEIIAKALSCSPEVDETWLERDFGDWNQISYRDTEFVREQPAYFTPYDRPGRTGESAMDTYRRGIAAVQSILARPPGSYLIVSHDALINMVLFAMLGIFPSPAYEGPRFPHANTGMTTLMYQPDRFQWLLLGVNDHIHIDGI